MGKKTKWIILVILLLGGYLVFSGSDKSPIVQIMDRYLWTKSVMFIMAPSPDHPKVSYQHQIMANLPEIGRRKIVVIDVFSDQMVRINGEVKPHIGSHQFYNHLRADKQNFQVLLFRKDGEFERSYPIGIPYIELRHFLSRESRYRK